MNETQINLQFKNSVTNQKALEKYATNLSTISNLLNGIDQGKLNALSKSQTTINNMAVSVKNVKNETTNLGKQFNLAFNTAGVLAMGKVLLNLGKKFASLTKLSSAYIENVNLLEVAYYNANEDISESSKRIEDFIDKMSKAYGLDESRLTRQFGVFKQLANAMDLPIETAENLSEHMVKMTNDIASLYNLDLNRASNALQSALVGQVRPIRGATGADITEKTLQKTVDNLGLDRSISQLSFVEKRLIMVISLTEQLKNSQGDYARTIESVSNQVRVMHEQWDRLSRAIGNAFYPILEKILPYLNAILMVLTEIFNYIAKILGFKMPEFDYSGLAGASDATNDLIEGMDEAGVSVDNLKDKMKGLRGFDKLNVISTPTDSSSSAGVGGIDPTILNAFNTAFDSYNDKMDEVKMKATQLAESWMKWLKEHKNELKTVASIIGMIVGTSLLGKIPNILSKIGDAKGITKFTDIFTKSSFANGLKNINKLLKFIFSPTGLIIGGVVLLAAAFVKLYKENDEFREKVNKLVKTLGDTLKPTLESVGELTKEIMKILKDLWEKVVVPLLLPVFEIVIDLLTVALKVLQPILNAIKDILIPIMKIIVGIIEMGVIPVLQAVIKALDWIWHEILEPIIDVVGNVLVATLKGVINFIGDIFKGDWSKAWEDVKAIFKAIFDGIYTSAVDTINKIINKLNEGIDAAKELWGYMTKNEETGSTGIKAMWEFWTKGIKNWNEVWGNAKGGVYANGKWNDITSYATGTQYAPTGQLFVAREAGAELVGNLGGHTAVMNNDQIVASVSDGVYRAVKAANGNGQSKGTQVYNIYLDESHKIGTYTLEQLQDMARTNGKPITIGG